MVLPSTSLTNIPPLVMTALSVPINPVMVAGMALRRFTIPLRCSLVTLSTLISGLNNNSESSASVKPAG